MKSTFFHFSKKYEIVTYLFPWQYVEKDAYALAGAVVIKLTQRITENSIQKKFIWTILGVQFF